MTARIRSITIVIDLSTGEVQGDLDDEIALWPIGTESTGESTTIDGQARSILDQALMRVFSEELTRAAATDEERAAMETKLPIEADLREALAEGAKHVEAVENGPPADQVRGHTFVPLGARKLTPEAQKAWNEAEAEAATRLKKRDG